MNLHETDAEFMERFERFAFKEIVNTNGKPLDDWTRNMVVLASLIGCQGVDAYKVILPKALDDGLSPVVVKEIVYLSVDFLGMGRILPFLAATNIVMEARGVHLPLPDLSTATMQERLEKSEKPQNDVLGEQMKEVWKDSCINKWLSENFSGSDTRSNLTHAQRELLAFCFLMAQGGCDAQLVVHAKGNMNLGNNKEVLINVISQCLPYIGYPRCLNALNCVNEAQQQVSEDAK